MLIFQGVVNSSLDRLSFLSYNSQAPMRWVDTPWPDYLEVPERKVWELKTLLETNSVSFWGV